MKSHKHTNITSKRHLRHTAKKRFGQNFLVDQNIIHAIVSAINPQPDDNVIEIGPGLGALTEPVGELVDHLTVIELDHDLVHRLKHHPFLHTKLTVIEEDALKVDFKALASTGRKTKIFGNLPYNISTPLILHLIRYRDIVAEMNFMLQKEVVDRMCALSGNKQYGRLSLIVQYFFQVLPVIDVSPESFKPAPKVQSAVVKLIPHVEIKEPVKDVATFEKVTNLAFGQRRKTIRNSLSTIINTEQQWQELEEFGIKTNLRAEQITLSQFIKLTNYIIDHGLFQAVNAMTDVPISDTQKV